MGLQNVTIDYCKQAASCEDISTKKSASLHLAVLHDAVDENCDYAPDVPVMASLMIVP